VTTWIGLDIGGANLKAATSDGEFASIPFPMWQQHQKLGQNLEELVRQLNTSPIKKWPDCFAHDVRLAAVMTGELADCFASKEEGVAFIVDCVGDLCDRLSLPVPVFGCVGAGFLDAQVAKRETLKVAAANWYFLATYAGMGVSPLIDVDSASATDINSGIVVDVGSTTMDIIPVLNGSVFALGKTDIQRLKRGELVYAGVGRTPIFGLLDRVMIGERSIPIANEYFASAKDAFVVAGELPEALQDLNTADGRARSMSCCRHRLARCVCADECELQEGVIDAIASQAIASLGDLLQAGLKQVMKLIPEQKPAFGVVGEGAGFAASVIKRIYPACPIRDLDHLFPKPGLVSVAPAYALSRIAAENESLRCCRRRGIRGCDSQAESVR